MDSAVAPALPDMPAELGARPSTMLGQEEGRHYGETETPTCRICRGEETSEEPLFFPCKCSGSIRFVHQACLMEWLARSQKRHCELCKTPFRFTKLYDPKMPAAVPFPIFAKQAAIQMGRNVLRILRWSLVAFVWLCWVPWAMRTMWRLLFWLGDGAWVGQQWQYEFELPGHLGTFKITAHSTLPKDLQNVTLPTSMVNATASASSISTSSAVPGWSSLFGHTFAPLSDQALANFTRSQHLMIRVGKRLLKGMLPLAAVSPALNESSSITHDIPMSGPYGSLLSEVSYLNNLTEWRAVNRTIVDILEGQLITLFVMILIILVFLIREWVVQQQPGPGVPRVAAPQLAVEVQPAQAGQAEAATDQQTADGQDQTREIQGDPSGAAVSGAADGDVSELTAIAAALPDSPGTWPANGPRATSNPSGLSSTNSAVSTTDSVINDTDGAQQPCPTLDGDLDTESLSHRPSMPGRNALDRASELHRVLEEERSKISGDRWPGITTFMEYWSRGDCRPEKVLDLIHGEGREEELIWIIRAMERLRATETASSSKLESLSSPKPGLVDVATNSEHSDTSSDSWQVVDKAGPPHSRHVTQKLSPNDDPQMPSWFAAHRNEIQDSADPEVDPTALIKQHTATGPDHDTGIVPVLDPFPEASGSAANDMASVLEPQAEEVAIFEEQVTQVVVPGEPINRDIGRPVEQDDIVAEVAPAAHDVLGSANDRHTQATEAEPDRAQRSWWNRLAELMWGGVELPQTDQQQVAAQLRPMLQPEAEPELPLPIPEPVEEAPAQEELAIAGEPPPDPVVLHAAAEAGLNAEELQAIEEAEELDGLVELVGLQGPLLALVQHAMVCAAIVSLVVIFGIWIPYIIGKVVLVLMSNPVTLLIKVPLRWASFIADVMVDIAIFVAGGLFFWTDGILRTLVKPVGWLLPFFSRMQANTVVPDTAIKYSWRAVERISKSFTGSGDGFADSDIPYFSVIAHESLVAMESTVYNATVAVYHWLQNTLESSNGITDIFGWVWHVVKHSPVWSWSCVEWELKTMWKLLMMVPSVLLTNPFKLRLDFPERTEPLNLELIHWNTRDRILAIMFGYLAFYIVGALYVKTKTAIRDENSPRDEALDVLNQAGGVLKVILIISIEMIVFPLYCGLLLDIAMLPLFKEATVLSRLAFAVRAPATSIFLHWFVGTCYMFHFALFVSMCRKAMRSGVLYFIRDPDDPTFHPVRDVLERSLSGQLRKIAFSALVYGALVIVCLGAVVWGVATVPVGILPIKWSTFDPTTELPIDLVVYNFLIPVALKFFDPSQGLEDMFKWWFHKCARGLRLSHFLFSERREDEEGYWIENRDASSVRLEKNSDNVSDVTKAVPELDSPEPSSQPTNTPISQDSNGTFVRTGRFVRAPASDRVRIPRGQATFLPVDEHNNRIDGEPEPHEGLHAKDDSKFELIYLPPHFQIRIGLFVVLLWSFAAVTGLSMMVLPLTFGRFVFSRCLSADAPVNDVHAFAFGAYTLGGPLLLGIKHKSKVIVAWEWVKSWTDLHLFRIESVQRSLRQLFSFCLRALRVLYFYTSFGMVLPALLSIIFEFYIFIPLYTLTGSESPIGERLARISVIQNWTLGILYLKIAGRVIQQNQDSRPARALYALVAPHNNGATWLDPDVKLATRAFILPSLLLIGTIVTAPLLAGLLANSVWFRAAAPHIQTAVYRYSYPAFAAIAVVFAFVRALGSAYQNWRSRIRDEVYLVGERLHNFGEKRPVIKTRIAPAA